MIFRKKNFHIYFDLGLRDVSIWKNKKFKYYLEKYGMRSETIIRDDGFRISFLCLINI